MKLDMKQHNKKGKLITLCGLDGCGKTTLINMLRDKLCDSGYKVELTKQPTNSIRESKIFRTYMDEENHSGYDYRSLSLLAASDRMQHSNKYIIPLLEKENIVISDRYFYSCICNLRARGFTEDNWIYDIARHIPKPDLAFFLDVDVDTALSRIRERENEKNKWIDIDLQYKLKDEYINICKKNNGILVNTNQAGEDSFDIVWQSVTSLLEGRMII